MKYREGSQEHLYGGLILFTPLTSTAYIRKYGVDFELIEWPSFAEGIREHCFFSSLKLKLALKLAKAKIHNLNYQKSAKGRSGRKGREHLLLK